MDLKGSFRYFSQNGLNYSENGVKSLVNLNRSIIQSLGFCGQVPFPCFLMYPVLTSVMSSQNLYSYIDIARHCVSAVIKTGVLSLVAQSKYPA